MRFGMSLTSSVAAQDPLQGARWMVDRTRAAWAAGLDSLSLGDHHAMSSPYYQNTPMLGRLLAEWDGRPAGCLFLLPLWNPVLAAEHIGTLAALVDAPFIVQTGIGGGDAQFAAMGANLRTRGQVLDESIRVIKALLAGETVSSEMLGVDQAIIRPVPTQPVEWWVGGHSPAAIKRAAREGTAWYTGPNLQDDEGAELIAQYRSACADAGTTPKVIVRKDMLLLPDADKAEAAAAELLAAGYRGMQREHVLVGDAASARHQLEPLAELGVHEVIARCMSPDQATAISSINQLGHVRRQFV